MAAATTSVEVVYEQTATWTVKYNWAIFDYDVDVVSHRVVKKEDGLYYPQKDEMGRYIGFFTGYQQFTTKPKFKSFKSEKGAISFLKRYIAEKEERTRRLATP
jgi:hypothetical protein